MCNVISFVCLEYFDFLYVSVLPYMFALGLFLSKVYEVVLLRFDIPCCVEVFVYLRRVYFMLLYSIPFKT